MRGRSWITGALTLVVIAGCGGEGGVELRLDLPSAAKLDPLDGRVSSVTLNVTAAGDTVYSATREFPGAGAGVDFGRVPIGEGLSFELVGRTSASQVVAYGRTPTPVDVSSDTAREVDVPVRRPYVYIAGADGVLAVDGTAEPDSGYDELIAPGATSRAVAVTADGSRIVVAAGGELGVISTADHEPGDNKVTLAAPAVHLAVSPDGHWAVVSHTDNADPDALRGVSIVDLDRLGDADAVRFVATEAAGEVAVGNDTAWVLQNPLASLACTGDSSVAAIELDAGTAADSVDLGGPAVDIVAGNGVVYAAMPCSNQVVKVLAGAVQPTPVLEVAGASALSLARGRLWAMGHIDGEFAHLILASSLVDGSDRKVLDLPTLEERAVATALVGPGQDGLIRMTADLASASEMTVLPDGEHVAILVTAVYLTDSSGDAGNGQPILPVVQMVTYEYQLVQLATGLPAQRLRTTCAISWDPGALLDDFACARAPGQDVSVVDFVPRRITALFGAR